MKVTLLHRIFALLLVSGLITGPAAHGAFAGEHCAHTAVQGTLGEHSSDGPVGIHTSADPSDCEHHSQLCPNCLPWAAAVGHLTNAPIPDPLAATLAGWGSDQSPSFQLHYANSARGPPSPLI